LTTAIAPFTVGEKVKFTSEKRRYTVRAAGVRFAVLNKPFNPKNTVLYTVVDLQEGIRGTENLVFGAGAETPEQCEAMLKRLEAGETEVSHRNYVNLDIESREVP